jgi:hypothetical protein
MVSSVALAQSAQAADVSSFDAGNLISDTVFYDGGATKAGTIQALLNAQGSGCVAAGTLKCLKNITINVPKSSGDQYCAAVAAHSGQTAASVFATVGSACSINPAVLVVLVQKEQSLVTRSSPTAAAYEHATGYNCPDTAPCSTATAGFYTQVYHAAKQFQRYRQNPSSYHFRAGKYNTIAFHPASTSKCSSSSVYIENSATAGLYDYTPYQPNRAALSNLTGTGDSCSSYGNRNFWRYFNDWFGNTGNMLKASSFEGSVSGWSFGSKVGRALQGTATGTVSQAQAGQYYLAANTSVSNSEIHQTVNHTLTKGKTYSGSVWLRAASSTVPYTGKVVVWGLGGKTEAAVTPFSVGHTWTQVTANLIPQVSGHRQLRIAVYLTSTRGNIQLDSADLVTLSTQPARGAVAMSSPSFEQGLGAWTFKNGFINRKVYNLPASAENGSKFLAVNTRVAGRSVGLDVAHAPLKGDTYTTTVWMRSGSATAPFKGSLVLWALGGSSEHAITTFTVGHTWTPVLVNLPILKSGHSRLRIEAYLASTKIDLQLDNASLTGNLIANGSFETNPIPLVASKGTSTISPVVSDPTVPGLIAGAREASFSVPTTGNSVAVGVNRRLTLGETYTASAWVRTKDPTQSFTGTLALWATGGTLQNSTTAVAVSGAWTRVQVQLKITNATNNHLKVEMYSSSPSVVLEMDGLVLQ